MKSIKENKSKSIAFETRISVGISLFNKNYIKSISKNRSDIQTEKKVLENIELKKNNGKIFNNYYIKIVSNLLIETEWYNMYRLNLLDTLNLDYSVYMYLKEMLDEREKQSESAKRKVKDKLDKIQNQFSGINEIV